MSCAPRPVGAPPLATQWKPTAGPEALALRARIYATARRFFADAGVMEVETPLASAAANSDPAIESLKLAADDPRYLRTSPEFGLKRLVAAGSGPVYELGRVFRAGEKGRWHNPEFSMLEWYRPGFALRQMIDEAAGLLEQLFQVAGRRLNRIEQDYQAMLSRVAGGEAWTWPLPDLQARVRDLCHAQGELSRAQCLDLLFVQAARGWPGDRLTVVTGFPASQAALARLDPDHADRALRFELFAGEVELANGYDELRDANELARRIHAENLRREDAGQVPMPVDERLLEAHVAGLPACCGVSIGMDRVVMCAGGFEHIDEVIAFPWQHA